MKLLFILLFFTQLIFAQSWLQLADFPATGRDDGVGVTVNNLAYFGTGLRASGGTGADFYAFNPLQSTWSAIAPMPAGQERQYACAFTGPGCFYVFGGDAANGPANDLYKYTISSNTWAGAAPKPGNGVYGASSFELGDKIIIIGGKSPASNFAHNEVWEYTKSTDTWLQKNNFPFGGRFRASTAVINTTGYLLFGVDEQDQLRREMYRYDQANDSWAKILDFPQPLGRAYATLNAVNGKLILFGGYDNTGHIYNDIWYFDPVSAVWTKHVDFPSAARKCGMSAVINGKFYYTCGVTNTERLKETWVLDVPVGINETKSQELFSVYPNPVKDMLTLRAGNQLPLNGIMLFDVTGKALKNETVFNLQNNTAQLDVSGFDKGFYFLKVQSGEIEEWKRIVKE